MSASRANRMDGLPAEIAVQASPEVGAQLEGLGRTEDASFSPDDRRLALACFMNDAIAVADIEIGAESARPQVTVHQVTEYTSPQLRMPHGLEFLDDQTLVVANRGGTVVVFHIPSGARELVPIASDPVAPFDGLATPGSVAIATTSDRGTEVLVCNNDGNRVTRHRLGRGPGPLAVEANEVEVDCWLDLPDGVAVNEEGSWLAVSNHLRHAVMVYDRSRPLDGESGPDCILRGVGYPHGLRFTPDGHVLFVADAGAPYVHVYEREGSEWQGVRYPTLSLRVLDEDVFLSGHEHPEEGGPKGIAFDSRGAVLAVTAWRRSIAFFDVAAVLDRATQPSVDHAQQIRIELDAFEGDVKRLRGFEARLDAVKQSRSFRMTAPLRRLNDLWLRWRLSRRRDI